MKRVLLLPVILVAAWTVAQNQLAAPPLFAPSLLMIPAVQKELKLTAAQVQQFQGLMGVSGGLGAPPAKGSSEKDFRKRLDDARKSHEQASAKAMAGLSASQKARLKQITLQMYGVSVVGHPTISQELGITADQMKAISAIQAANAREMSKLFTTAGAPSATSKPEHIRRDHAKMMKQMGQRTEKMTAMRTAMEARITKVLTPQQKQKWNQMLGRKFNMPSPTMAAPRKAIG